MIEANFQTYHELMAKKVREILLVASPYDAFVMEEEGSLASRVINEYRGLNLSEPPRIYRVSTAVLALESIAERHFDLVLTTPRVDAIDGFSLGRAVKALRPDLPVILLAHDLRAITTQADLPNSLDVDQRFIWSVDSDLLLAIIKNVEDHLNAAVDCQRAQVRVLILIEDSPIYKSYFLPFIYREVVKQIQEVLAESLNEEHRLLKMRARPKILVAGDYEQAMELYEEFKPYLFGIISDARIPRKGQLDDRAGLDFLTMAREEIPDLPILLLSSESTNRAKAMKIPAVFLDKNSPTILTELHDFFLNQLGFGDFVFRYPDGKIADWASNLQEFEQKIATIPAESLLYHASRNHFSTWIMARSEIYVASRLREVKVEDFANIDELRGFVVSSLHALRKMRQYGIVANFSTDDFDAEIMDFVKIGNGSMGGKAMGLAFMAHQLLIEPELPKIFDQYPVKFPKTLVVTSDGFEAFVRKNSIKRRKGRRSDEEIAKSFLFGEFPSWLQLQLAAFLDKMDTPLSIRSSSLLEDAQYKPYAGLYDTYMLPNNHPDFQVRLKQLLQAVKLVYASTWFAGPQAFGRRGGQARDDAMAIIIQELVGGRYGDYFYPAISGVAQSHNYYPVAGMKPEEGVFHIALGMGKTVVEGETSLRLSPKYPGILPQFSTVEDILANSQRYFYALAMSGYPEKLTFGPDSNLIRREISEAEDEFPIKKLSSTYIHAEDRIRDGIHPGPKVLTFASIIKYGLFPLPDIIGRIVELGHKSMGGPVEIEFAVDLAPEPEDSRFYFLQIRPMVAGSERLEVEISDEDIARAFCVSDQALGHGRIETISDIVFVDPGSFKPGLTREIAMEMGRINTKLSKEERSYLAIAPGRWGSADPWLGIPVNWQDISGVGAIVELRNDLLKAEPSQGSHFFQNITSLGIPYITITEGVDKLSWQWLNSQQIINETNHIKHVRADKPFIMKIDGKASRCVILA